MFKALMVDKTDSGISASIEETSTLPDGDVTVAVDYSTINYKDGLAITGKSPILKSLPMTPGIDFAGTVEDSQHPDFKAGDKVILNGWGVGESHPGGLAQKARVMGDWLIPLPAAFSPEQAMAIGTAGYTAALCVIALENAGITPDKGPILVTGAAGGVGSVAIKLLAKKKYYVIASTGRAEEQKDYLTSLGAGEIIDRTELSEKGRPLGKQRWAGAIDSVGSHTLANVLASTHYGGVVAACGLAQGFDLPATVMPFILRGVTLKGVDSVMAPKADRLEAWQLLARTLEGKTVESWAETRNLSDAITAASDIMDGKIRGRVVIDVNK